jgi:hypothetical protein
MRINAILFLIAVFISGCSSLRGTLITSSVLGGSLGAMSGVIFSPNTESKPGNALIFGTIGAVAGALIGNYFYSNDPENRDLKQMLYEKDLKGSGPNQTKDVGLFDFAPELKNIKPDVSFKPVKKYDVPMEKLPENLKGKVKKQYLLEYETEGKTIQYEGRTIEIAPFKAWEHVYE